MLEIIPRPLPRLKKALRCFSFADSWISQLFFTKLWTPERRFPSEATFPEFLVLQSAVLNRAVPTVAATAFLHSTAAAVFLTADLPQQPSTSVERKSATPSSSQQPTASSFSTPATTTTTAATAVACYYFCACKR